MNQQPLVSIVVPVYNCIQHLPECLKSIRSQTFTDWETVLVDDGSNDGSGDLCDREAASDPRFRVIHKENGGVSTARNAGIDAARGTYLAFIDSDDLIVPTYLEKLSRAAQRFDADIAICGYDRVFPDWELHFSPLPFSVGLIQGTKDFLMLFTEARTNLFGVSIWAKLYRMDIIRDYAIRFDPEISYEEDCDFNVRYLAYVNTVAAVGDILYRYRQSDDTLSKAYRKDTFRFLAHGFQKRMALLEQNGMEEFRPKLEAIFLLVVKATALKILNAGLPKKEELAEYRTMIAFPESQAAARYQHQERPKSGFTRRIAAAVRHRSPRQLYAMMHIWKIADKLADLKNNIAYKLKNR